MKLEVQFEPHILNFPNLHSETVEVENYIHALTKNVVALEELPEWTIRFLIHLEKEGCLGIYKKGSTYPSYPPEKMYAIHVPIPTNEDIIWGVRKKDFTYRPQIIYDMARDEVEGIKFSNFDSLSSYIVECSKIGIEQLLKKGISLKGVKIKVK
jgi:hypothetical protein